MKDFIRRLHFLHAMLYWLERNVDRWPLAVVEIHIRKGRRLRYIAEAVKVQTMRRRGHNALMTMLVRHRMAEFIRLNRHDPHRRPILWRRKSSQALRGGSM